MNPLEIEALAKKLCTAWLTAEAAAGNLPAERTTPEAIDKFWARAQPGTRGFLLQVAANLAPMLRGVAAAVLLVAAAGCASDPLDAHWHAARMGLMPYEPLRPTVRVDPAWLPPGRRGYEICCR